jgi:hypothetical protein
VLYKPKDEALDGTRGIACRTAELAFMRRGPLSTSDVEDAITIELQEEWGPNADREGVPSVELLVMGHVRGRRRLPFYI